MSFKSLGAVSYSPSIVTVAVSAAFLEIFSVKEWPDLENIVRVHSRLLEMVPFDRSRYLVSFAKYSDLLVENRANFIPHLYLAPPQAVTPSEFREDLGTHKTRMNGLSCGEESMTIYSAVLIGCQRVTDRRTDGRTSMQPISITCFSISD